MGGTGGGGVNVALDLCLSCLGQRKVGEYRRGEGSDETFLKENGFWEGFRTLLRSFFV